MSLYDSIKNNLIMVSVFSMEVMVEGAGRSAVFEMKRVISLCFFVNV